MSPLVGERKMMSTSSNLKLEKKKTWPGEQINGLCGKEHFTLLIHWRTLISAQLKQTGDRLFYLLVTFLAGGCFSADSFRLSNIFMTVQTGGLCVRGFLYFRYILGFVIALEASTWCIFFVLWLFLFSFHLVKATLCQRGWIMCLVYIQMCLSFKRNLVFYYLNCVFLWHRNLWHWN